VRCKLVEIGNEIPDLTLQTSKLIKQNFIRKFRSNEEKLNEYTFFFKFFLGYLKVCEFLEKTFISIKKV
jgi:hypothetical protein